MGTISDAPGVRKARRAFLGGFSSGLSGLSGLFMPALCVHCRGDRWRGTPLCLACLKNLRPLRPGSEVRAVREGSGLLPSPETGSNADSQSANSAEPQSGTETDLPSRFLFRMGPGISTLIHGFKYRHQRRHIRFLCAYLRYRPDLAVWAGGFDALIPVPIHAIRKRERGYNQAGEIALEAARHLRLPVWDGVLLRTRSTVSQTKLDREGRAMNLARAFALPDPQAVRGKRLLLVDDVHTTGATVGRCAELLLQAGAVSVGVLALAKVEAGSSVDDFALELEAISGYAG
jgi:ComF family protein